MRWWREREGGGLSFQHVHRDGLMALGQRFMDHDVTGSLMCGHGPRGGSTELKTCILYKHRRIYHDVNRYPITHPSRTPSIPKDKRRNAQGYP